MSCAARSRMYVQLEGGHEEAADELLAEGRVGDPLGGEGAGGGVVAGVEQFVDGGAQDRLEVGLDVAGVRDAVRLRPVTRSGGLSRLDAEVDEGLHEDLRL